MLLLFAVVVMCESAECSETGGSFHLADPDASIIDVYKNAQAVVFIFDICRRVTWDYARREAENVPEGVSILFLVRGVSSSRSLSFSFFASRCC